MQFWFSDVCIICNVFNVKLYLEIFYFMKSFLKIYFLKKVNQEILYNDDFLLIMISLPFVFISTIIIDLLH